jgi:hypothetical protein
MNELAMPKVDTRPDEETKRRGAKIARTPALKLKSRLRARQWAEAIALWELGEVTLADLHARFGLSAAAFAKYFKQHGIEKGSKVEEHSQRVRDAIVDVATTDATILAARIRETKEEHYRMAVALAKLTWGEILAAKQGGAPMAVAMGNLKALDTAMGVLKKAREERYAVLGLNRDDFVDQDGLPQLVVSELTPEQVTALRNQNHLGFDELKLDVDHFMGGNDNDDDDKDDNDNDRDEEGDGEGEE